MRALTTTAVLLVAACGEPTATPPMDADPIDASPEVVPDAGGEAGWTDLLGTPLATDAPALATVTHGLIPTAAWGAHAAPRPTNSWWLNLMLGGGANPVNVLPYLVKALPDRLSVCRPGRVTGPTYVAEVFHDNLSLGATEVLPERTLQRHDPLSVTIRWGSATAAAAMRAPLVRGMPYATMFYAGATPRIRSQHAIVAVNGAAAGPHTGTRFALALNNGQTWILYASQPVTLVADGGGLVATAPLTGSLRAAIDPGGAAALLDAHAGAIPVGATVRAQSRGDAGRLIFDWQTEGEGELLMLALPHHHDAIDGAALATGLAHTTIKGEMRGVLGRQWVLSEPLPTITWTAPRPIDPARHAAIAAALAGDRDLAPVASDTYFFGKQAAAMARLALIADELGDTTTAEHVRGNLAAALDPWLRAGTDRLSYDTTWGGILPAGTHTDPGAAFGAGYYNDHHFHYGYFLYAAAALAHGDPAWADAHTASVRDLARDIANPSAADPWFPVLRNKDWFDGHSWAAGLFEFADSRNQESSSEAVNAWYGLALWGLATGDRRLHDLGRILLATELRSTQAYWQVSSANDPYGPPFSDTKVVGVLWSTKVDYATFFGSNVEFIHGIQMLPFTPITELLLPAPWIAEQYPVFATALDRPSPPLAAGWRGFIYMAHAVLDPAAAWTEAQSLTAYDDGNSRTNTLYWIATRP